MLCHGTQKDEKTFCPAALCTAGVLSWGEGKNIFLLSVPVAFGVATGTACARPQPAGNGRKQSLSYPFSKKRGKGNPSV